MLSVPLKRVTPDKDVGKHTVVMTDMKAAIDALYINDAVVPVVQSHYTCHNAKKEELAKGISLVVQARIRGPTYLTHRQT